MISPLFAMSYHFLPMEKYRAFFSHLINDAERIYREHLEAFQAQIDSALKPEFFEDVEPLDRPYATASLQHRLEVAERAGRARELAEELAEVKQQSKKKDKHIRTLEAIVGRRSRKKAGPKKKKR
jgi:tryptophan 2,3-dioxygenase